MDNKEKQLVCLSSPYCSHNTNGRDLSKPCCISFSIGSPTQQKQGEWEKELLAFIEYREPDEIVLFVQKLLSSCFCCEGKCQEQEGLVEQIVDLLNPDMSPHGQVIRAGIRRKIFNLISFILSSQKASIEAEIREKIESVVSIKPDLESDDFDSGRQSMKDEILKLLESH